jgi:hypothetical protein
MASLVAALSPANITRYYPVVDPLAAPTDLHRHEVSAVVEAVNPLIADAFALYLKTKNYHWHASGAHFRDYHLLFDEQAEGILGSIDVLAEWTRKLGGRPSAALATSLPCRRSSTTTQSSCRRKTWCAACWGTTGRSLKCSGEPSPSATSIAIAPPAASSKTC